MILGYKKKIKILSLNAFFIIESRSDYEYFLLHFYTNLSNAFSDTAS